MVGPEFSLLKWGLQVGKARWPVEPMGPGMRVGDISTNSRLVYYIDSYAQKYVYVDREMTRG